MARSSTTGAGCNSPFRCPAAAASRMTHLNLPGVPDYTERVTVYCRDRIVELTFPSPYLRHFPTRLVVKRAGAGRALESIEHRVSYEEAFREELRAFHAAATGQAPVQTTIEQARRDIAAPDLRVPKGCSMRIGVYSDSLPKLDRRDLFAWCAERGIGDIELGVGAWGPWPRPHLDLATIGDHGRARPPWRRASRVRSAARCGQRRRQPAASRCGEARRCAGSLPRGGRIWRWRSA